MIGWAGNLTCHTISETTFHLLDIREKKNYCGKFLIFSAFLPVAFKLVKNYYIKTVFKIINLSKKIKGILKSKWENRFFISSEATL